MKKLIKAELGAFAYIDENKSGLITEQQETKDVNAEIPDSWNRERKLPDPEVDQLNDPLVKSINAGF